MIEAGDCTRTYVRQSVYVFDTPTHSESCSDDDSIMNIVNTMNYTLMMILYY